MTRSAAPLHDVGAVIVTYNSRDEVDGALDGLPAGELAGVVVVDNGSTDGTADHVEQAARPGVAVLRQDNRGFGAGCNAGAARLPDARLLLFLNPDAVIGREDLARLVSYLAGHPRAALVAPRLTQGGEVITSSGEVATARSELRFALPHRLGRLLPDRRHSPDRLSGPVGVVEGACMLVDAAAFRAAGGFDERYFLFFEEHDLALRLAGLGREVHLCAEARASHAVGRSRDSIPVAGRDEYWSSAIRFLRTWRGRRGAVLVDRAVRLSSGLDVRRGRIRREDRDRLVRALSAGWRA